jgi:hypothetical protein
VNTVRPSLNPPAANAREQRSQFVEQALVARMQMLQSGLGHDAGEVHAYLRNRISDNQISTPEAKAWRKQY